MALRARRARTCAIITEYACQELVASCELRNTDVARTITVPVATERRLGRVNS
jgi:hypothetical protein